MERAKKKARRCFMEKPPFRLEPSTEACTKYVTKRSSPLGSELRGDPPGIPTRVFDAAPQVGVAGFLNGLLDGDAAGSQGFLVGGLGVGHVNMEPGGAGRIGAAGVGDHYHRVI